MGGQCAARSLHGRVRIAAVTEEEAKAAAHEALRAMEQILQRHGQAMALCLLFGEKQTIGANVLTPGGVKQSMAFKALHLKAIALKARAMVFAAEVWLADEMPPAGRQVSDMETRKEAVIAAAAYFDEHGERQSFLISRDILRDESGAVIGLATPQEKTIWNGGEVLDIFPESPPTESQAREAERIIQRCNLIS